MEVKASSSRTNGPRGETPRNWCMYAAEKHSRDRHLPRASAEASSTPTPSVTTRVFQVPTCESDQKSTAEELHPCVLTGEPSCAKCAEAPTMRESLCGLCLCDKCGESLLKGESQVTSVPIDESQLQRPVPKQPNPVVKTTTNDLAVFLQDSFKPGG